MGGETLVDAHLPAHNVPNALRAGRCALANDPRPGGYPASMGALGPTRPDRLTVWPVENDGFGIDVRWSGADGRGWELRVGPVPGADVARMIDEFVW